MPEYQFNAKSNFISNLAAKTLLQSHSMTNPPPCIQLIKEKEGKVRDLDLVEAVVIGRSTNASTRPNSNNGYFDSKVLSRQHAKFYSNNGKVFLIDLGSANGTFIDNKRLSEEGQESAPIEVKNGDVVAFGVDIIEDGKVVYEKVQFTIGFDNEPVPVTTLLDSRAGTLEKNAIAQPQQKVKSASIRTEKPELPQKPTDNSLVNAMQQGVARVQEQTQEIAKIQTQLQSISNDTKLETKLSELQNQQQQQVAAFNKRISALESGTAKITIVVNDLLARIASESETSRKEQVLLQAQLQAIQKTNMELLNRLESGNKSSKSVLLTNIVKCTMAITIADRNHCHWCLFRNYYQGINK